MDKMKTLDMTSGNSMKIILKFSLPLLVGIVFQQAYNLADTMVVGYGVSADAVAAVGSTSAIYSVLILFTMGLNSGFGVVVANLFGAGDTAKLKKAVAIMFLLDMVITFFLTIICLPLLKPLLKVIAIPDGIFRDAYAYIFIILAGMITTVAYNMAAGFMRSVGNSKTPVYFLILSCGINITLDLIFIMGLKIGVIGAALATVISEGISAFLCIVYIRKHYLPLLPGRKDWGFEPALTKKMLGLGVSMGLMQSVFAIGTIILQSGINGLGTTIITAHTASRKIYELFMMAFSAVSTAVPTFVSQNVGAGRYDRVKDAMKQTVIIQLIWSVTCIFFIFTIGKYLIQYLIGTSDKAIIEPAMLNLKVCVLFFFPLGILVVIRNILQPLGNKIAPVISSGIELVAKLLFTLHIIPKLGYLGVVITEPIIWVVCCIYLVIIYIMQLKKIEEST